MLDWPSDFLASRACGSVLLAWVSLLRGLPRQSRSALRPDEPLSPDGASGSWGPSFSPDVASDFGWNDLWLAQAWISVPSTEKCSSDISALTLGWLMIAPSNPRAMSPSSRRSRFLLKLLASHTGASTDSPTNQRNSRL